MTTDVFEVARALTEHAVAHYGDQIDLVAFYGSQARGEARPDSDLDFFFTPADGCNPPIGRCFLLEGRLFDFWGLSWETLDGFATGRLRGWACAPPLVWHAEILHARNDEARQRLAGLKEKIRELRSPAARPQMIARALDHFPTASAHLENLRRAVGEGSLTASRHAGWQVVEAVCECLALVNQTFFDQGLPKGLAQLDTFKECPDGMRERVQVLATSAVPGEILQSAEALAGETRTVLLRVQASVAKPRPAAEVFGQAYPELRDMVTKLRAACKKGDTVLASAQAWRLQDELTQMLSPVEGIRFHGRFNLATEAVNLYRSLGFPDLGNLSSGDLAALEEAAEAVDRRLREWLMEQKVDLCEYRTLDELRGDLCGGD